ncbi:hypothetical protein ACF0H5_007060 [Mactra antiquata]
MAGENVLQITPEISQLLTTNEKVSCTETGCNKTFNHIGSLRMHLVKSHGLFKNESDKCLFHGKKLVTKSTYHCPVKLCQYSVGAKKHFASYANVKQHYLKVHAERNHICDKCNNGYISEKHLKQHIEKCGVRYGCGTCPVKYTTKEALLTHCKRQKHVYPAEYACKQKEKRQTQKKSKTDQPVVIIINQPLVCVPPPQPETNKPKPVRKILCKPSVPEKNYENGSNSITPGVLDFEGQGEGQILSGHNIGQGHMLPRQEVFIQTDIYGVRELALSKDNMAGYSVVQNDKKSQHDKVTVTPKKSSSLKRRISFPGDGSSPRRKKTKSTTGIQTSVSLTKKKGVPIVNSTQTTGDYIIETALRQANIHIEKKTVALQVTPQKSLPDTKSRPVLVDSFSQVRQQNIYAETSHNLAERQTMTDIPPSISTQTLQSYLVNQQELRNKKHDTGVGPEPLPNCSHVLNANFIAKSDQNVDNSVLIYNETLQGPVKYVMPESVSNTRSKFTDISSGIYVPSKNDRDQNNFNNPISASIHHDIRHASTDFDALSADLHDHTKDVESSYLLQSHHTMDMGAQTMSASEFNTLLQSSGIFLNNNDFLSPGGAKSHQTMGTSMQGSSHDFNDCGNNVNFLSPASNTIDMNTQTVDLNLYDSLVPIDSNTQTGSDGLDFLDMVMTNMETQTLNDDDLINLGLLDASLSTSPGHEVGYRSETGTNVTQGLKSNLSECEVYQSKTTSTSTDVFSDLELLGLDKNPNYGCLNSSASNSNKSVVCKSAMTGSDGVYQSNVQMETQTGFVDFDEPLLQTETQTQVESTDTDFETINMETQTNFDDLQQFTDWIHS